MSLSTSWKKYQPKIKEVWGEIRESEFFDDVLEKVGLGSFGKYFKKETSPGSGVYESNLITPASIALAGGAGLLVYLIIKKKK